MSKEITLTTVPAASEDGLRAVLDEFEQKTRVHVNLQIVPWDKERYEIVGMALRRAEGDVLIVGTPITSDLIGMNALRPFSMPEITSLGGQAAFVPARWQSGTRPDGEQVFAIPWLLDVRALYFWRDMLAQAGFSDPAAIFATGKGIAEALDCLRSAGVAALPWAATAERYHILHAVSSWIWEQGGDLFSSGGRKVMFHEPAALAGIQAYFKMLRCTSPVILEANDEQLFRDRRAAVVIANAWAIGNQDLPAELGCVPLPGGSYIGGTDVMIWSHSRSDEASMALVRHLTQADVQWRLGAPYGQLPTRVSELTGAEITSHAVRGALARAALTGRTYPCVPMIGLVEDRLSNTLSQVQHELLANPTADVDALVVSRIVPLGKRTSLSFS